jgi:hypothetical protein
MLMAQSLVRQLELWSEGTLQGLPDDLVKEKVPVALLQALVHIIDTQQADGSWGTQKSPEESAYALTALCHIASLAFTSSLGPQIERAIESGRLFLFESRRTAYKPNYLWIEKVTYASESLVKAYTLAALKISSPERRLGERVLNLVQLPLQKIQGMVHFYLKLPLYSSMPAWKILASLIEGAMFLPGLYRLRLDIFPREQLADEKYFHMIPGTWTLANNKNGQVVSADFMFEMMVISVLNYQADEYMESVVGKRFVNRLGEVRQVIDQIFDENVAEDEIVEMPQTGLGVVAPTATIEKLKIETNVTTKEAAAEAIPDSPRSSLDERSSVTSSSMEPVSPTETELTIPASVDLSESKNFDHLAPIPEVSLVEQEADVSEVKQVLKRFTSRVLESSFATKASAYDQLQLRHELRTFLHAHTLQISDNLAMESKEFSSPNFYDWVKTTSADHTSCPYSFSYVSCLVSEMNKTSGKDCWDGAEEKYFAQDLCRRLATMCRIYNDYGSLNRDREEQNLNSMNFKEFTESKKNSDTERKAALWKIAQFERRGLDSAMGMLEMACQEKGGQRKTNVLKMFVDVTDTYGQIYVARDIGTRTK